MKKVGIVTLNGYFNYGNRLQNYAVQEVLKTYGFEVETLLVAENKSGNNTQERPLIKKIGNLKGNSLGDVFRKIQRKLWTISNKKKIADSKQLRTKIFKEFTSELISETDYRISESYIPKAKIDEFDFFVTGSDQVWNPDYISGSSIYFLTFAPKGKRIAFSPSFGVSEIPVENQKEYKQWISEMSYLSVREDDGAKIIKDLTDRNAPVLLDPTMLLTKEKWLSIVKEKSHITGKKYLLTYFLGGVPTEYRGKIKQIAKDNNLEVINLANIHDVIGYQTGPSEFVDYINKACIFCTDSFHGAAFSILLERPFIIFQRKGNSPSMYSRINTLLDTFQLHSRKFENIETNKNIFNVDYSHVPEILDKERQKAATYLKEALDVKN